MRFVYIILAAVALCVAAFFGVSTAAQISEINDVREKIEKNNADIAEFQSQIDGLKPDYDAVKERFDYLSEKQAAHEAEKKYLLEPVAFLTFDDAPSGNTKSIVDTLDKNGIKGTFYITGAYINSDEDKEIIKYISDHGHTLALHSYSHEYSKIYKSVDAFMEETYQTEQIIKDITGVDTKLVRFPSGTSSGKGFCTKYSGSSSTYEELRKRLDDEGYMVSDWYIDTNDWRASKTVSDIYSDVRSYGSARKNNSGYKAAIVLMHNKDRSLEILQGVIDILKEQGYSFEPIVNGGYNYVQAQVQGVDY